MAYKDLDYSCQSILYSPRVYLAAEVDGGKLLQAKLRLSPDSVTPKNSIDLNAAELAGSTLTVDKHNRTWVSKLYLETATLNWIFFTGSTASSLGGCAPKKGLQSIDPAKFTYHFVAPVQKEGEEIPWFAMRSEMAVFRGNNGWGKPYRIELSLVQEQF
jgi:hypothetical protein